MTASASQTAPLPYTLCARYPVPWRRVPLSSAPRELSHFSIMDHEGGLVKPLSLYLLAKNPRGRLEARWVVLDGPASTWVWRTCCPWSTKPRRAPSRIGSAVRVSSFQFRVSNTPSRGQLEHRSPAVGASADGGAVKIPLGVPDQTCPRIIPVVPPGEAVEHGLVAGLI